MGKHRLVVPLYPVQRVLRTVLLDVVVWAPTALLVIPEIVSSAHDLGTAGALSPATVAKISAIGGAAITADGLLVRLIALPRVDRLLHRIGLGTVPKKADRDALVRTVKSTAAAVREIEQTINPTSR